jgi:hypothetical protein
LSHFNTNISKHSGASHAKSGPNNCFKEWALSPGGSLIIRNAQGLRRMVSQEDEGGEQEKYATTAPTPAQGGGGETQETAATAATADSPSNTTPCSDRDRLYQ